MKQKVGVSMELCTDRTQYDVDRVREVGARINAVGIEGAGEEDRFFWFTGEGTVVFTLDGHTVNFRNGVLKLAPIYIRGAYNATDLNRVEGAVKGLSEALAAAGYGLSLSTRTGWGMEDFPTAMGRYLDNIVALRRAFCVKPSTPGLPESVDGLDYRGANAIEQNLYDMGELKRHMDAGYWYCGEPCCGEG